MVLNPFEALSVRWDPFAEIRAPWDVEQLASGLVPATEDPAAREWRGYARTFVAAVMRRCCECGWRDAGELWRLLTTATNAELRPLVAGSPAQPFLDPENARMFGSIRSVAASAAAALEYVCAQRARSFSVRDWVSGGRGVLFMPYSAPQIAALRTIIATWMRLAIFEAMVDAGADGACGSWSTSSIRSGPSTGSRTRWRGCENSAVAASRVSSRSRRSQATYGAGEAQTIVENCGNTLILRCSASEHGGTSQFASRLIGEREVLRRQTSRGRDRGWLAGGARRSTSVSEQRVVENAVLAAELEQLPDLAGYLKTASSPAWLRVAFRAAG